MLSLTDPKWHDFPANYTNGAQVAQLLARAESGEELDDWYEDLFQKLCHQYTVSQAAYPAAPHLVRLARTFEDLRTPLLSLLGTCHAFSEPSMTLAMPRDIGEDWHASAREALPILAELVLQPQPTEDDLRNLLSCIAAVSGYPSLAQSIESLDSEPG